MKRTDIGVEDLLDELRGRVMRLQRDARQLRSLGGLRELIEQTFEAGTAAGRAQQLAQETLRMAQLLDEATARMPDSLPDGVAASDAAISYWRDGRQHLWQLVERARAHIDSEQRAEQERAHKRRAWIEQRSGELFAPPAPLRVRVGRWLIDGSDFLAGFGKLRTVRTFAPPAPLRVRVGRWLIDGSDFLAGFGKLRTVRT